MKIKKINQKVHNFTAVFEPAKEGGYVVYIPALPGCATQGNTFEEAEMMARDAIEGYLFAMKDLKKKVIFESENVIITKIPAKIS